MTTWCAVVVAELGRIAILPAKSHHKSPIRFLVLRMLGDKYYYFCNGVILIVNLGENLLLRGIKVLLMIITSKYKLHLIELYTILVYLVLVLSFYYPFTIIQL